jgi:Ca-activated chloride channel family protein
MRSLTYLAVLMAVMAVTGSSALEQQQDESSFTTDAVELVVLSVTVTDREGQLIADLDRDQFSVFDNGRRQEVTLFSQEDAPVSIAMVLDDSGSMRGKIGQVLAATTAFARESHPEDEFFAFEFNDAVRDMLEGSSLQASDEPQLDAALRTLVPQGQTSLYDALLRALERLDRATHARKVILLVSDGGDNASMASLDDVLAHARKSNVTIYTIGLFDPGARDANPGVLKALAETTGGERFLPESPGPMVQACRQIAREIRSGYTFGYIPPERDGRFHAVRVRVEDAANRKFVVRTRPGYFAAKAAAQP